MTGKTKSSKNYAVLVGAAAVAVGVLMFSVAGMPSFSSAQIQGQGQEQQQANSAAQNGTTTVETGGGDAYAPVTWFIPQNVTISVGDTVTWTNPTPLPEPHTITFIKEPGYFANLQSPYLIGNDSELTPADPEEKNTEPLTIPGQNDTTSNTVIVANGRAQSPVIVDAQDNATYLALNANYTMTGDELYVNSGFLWPEGQIPPGAPPITTFSVTFENAGTFDYLCVIHPWMTGQVAVQ